jgi:hypothetical protein
MGAGELCLRDAVLIFVITALQFNRLQIIDADG